jgi:hypothetical protein
MPMLARSLRSFCRSAPSWVGVALGALERHQVDHPAHPQPYEERHLPGVSCPSQSACIAAGYYFNGSRFLTVPERWTR